MLATTTYVIVLTQFSLRSGGVVIYGVTAGVCTSMEWYAKDIPGVFDVLLWLVAIATTK